MRPDLKKGFDDLGDLTRWNLSLVKSQVFTREDFENVDVKKVGGTVGKIVRYVQGKGEDQFWLLKKSGRTQIDDKALDVGEDPEIVRSRSIIVPEKLQEGISESFNEKCAAQLFDIIKQRPGYLPQFALVSSTFNSESSEKKVTNKFRKDALKVYVASKIIGNNPKSINEGDDGHNIHLLDRRRPSHPELLEDVIDDVCENAVIMFLLSNYDVKIDNFFHSEENPKWMVPIDFGHARHDEKSSADIFDGIDLIRRARTGMTKVLSDTFSNRPMQSSFVKNKDYIGTQTFYYNNLKPRHFIEIIDTINGDPQIEQKLRETVYELTFGTPQDKEEYANIITTRVRNLLKIKNIFETIDPTTFPDKNLRDIVANSQEFEDDLKNTNHSKGKEFYRLIFDVFEKVEKDCRSIIAKLERYLETENMSDKEEIGAQIVAQVHEFNADARVASQNVKTSLEEVETYYQDSEYFRSESGRRDSWNSYKSEINYKLDYLFGMLLAPFEEEKAASEVSSEDEKFNWEVSDEESEQSERESFDEESEREDDESETSSSKSEKSGSTVSSKSSDESYIPQTPSKPVLTRAVSLESPDWDLNKCQVYKENLDLLLGQISDWQGQIKKQTKLLMTHLMAYDELQNVREDYREQNTFLRQESENSLQTFAEEARKQRKKPEGKSVTPISGSQKKLKIVSAER